MAERKSLSKKARFEVFKRDSFTCQYCGRKAPDVVLEVDHIKPIAEGGTNNIMNLITSCFDCNRGKGKRELSDNTTLQKQQKQMEILNEKRLQLEMLLDWRKELKDQLETEVEAIRQLLEEETGFRPNVYGRKDIKRLIHQFGFSLVYESTEIAILQYMEYEDSKSWNYGFNKIGGICYNINKERKENGLLQNDSDGILD